MYKAAILLYSPINLKSYERYLLSGTSGTFTYVHSGSDEGERNREVKAVQLKCIGELSKRMASAVARPRLSFNEPITIAKYYMERLRHEEQEILIVMLLDGKTIFLASRCFPGEP